MDNDDMVYIVLEASPDGEFRTGAYADRHTAIRDMVTCGLRHAAPVLSPEDERLQREHLRQCIDGKGAFYTEDGYYYRLSKVPVVHAPELVRATIDSLQDGLRLCWHASIIRTATVIGVLDSWDPCGSQLMASLDDDEQLQDFVNILRDKYGYKEAEDEE